MDIISYAKASQTLKGAKKYDAVTVAPGAEDRFETVDERIDYLENKLVGRYEDKVVEIDLKDGTFTNTEINENGELQLKDIKASKEEIINEEYTPGTIGALDGFSVERTTPIIGDRYDVSKLFDKVLSGDTSRYIGSETYPNIFTFINPKPIVLDKYMLYEGVYPDGAPKNWTVEGSNDKTNWTIIDTVKDNNRETVWKTFETDLKQPFLYHRFVFTANNGYYSYGVSITEMRIFRGNGHAYSQNGTWESNVIDLGGEWIETKYLKFTQDVAESHSINKEISYSDDGITFSDYELYDAELVGQHRFIKVRLELTSTDEVSDTTNYSYEAEGNKDFTFNKDSVIQTDRIVLNTNKKVNATSIKEGYYETDLTGFNRISKVKEVF